MLKSCSYCGRIHDSGHDCGCKPARGKRGNAADKFRSSNVWQRKREEIRQRDSNLCQCCLRNLPGTVTRLTYDRCSVHHAVPLEQDYNKRLDNDNLLLTCSVHHEMAERGEIPLDVIQKIIDEQEKLDR